jgi:hypothetical protein
VASVSESVSEWVLEPVLARAPAQESASSGCCCRHTLTQSGHPREEDRQAVVYGESQRLLAGCVLGAQLYHGGHSQAAPRTPLESPWCARTNLVRSVSATPAENT